MDREDNLLEKDKLSKSPIRNLSIQFSEDRLEAYISIDYQVIELKDDQEVKILKPPVYEVEEIKKKLLAAGIIYGIMDCNLKLCTNPGGVSKLLVAKGDKVINGEDDKLIINFDIDSTIKKLQEDNKGNVDFKSIGSVRSVKKGEVIAYRLEGKPGKDGRDVNGKEIKHKMSREVILKAGKGCEVVNDKVVAAIDGKPCMKSNSFYVFSVHEVRGDVDLKSGNILFSGDIIVQGSVKEGMKVQSGNSIIIKGAVERGQVTAHGDVTLDGNIIASKVISGGEDSEKLKLMEVVSNLGKNLRYMLAAVEEIKSVNLSCSKASDGQIIKLLLESKFKQINMLCTITLGALSKSKESGDVKIVSLLRNKLTGLSIIGIKHYSELAELCEYLDEKAKSIKETLSVPVNVKLGYVQDSTIISSGDIIAVGKGSYLSYLYANGSIFFIHDMSVVRGGILKANSEIRCKTVGSNAGAHTKLMVEDKGHIYIDIAYENTSITVGKREFVIDYDSKNVHAYLDKNGELNIDRLKL